MERGLKILQDRPELSLLLLGLLFYIPFLGGVHLFDWDEINFASISQEMALTGEYLQVNLGGNPFWEKPPLFFWLQAMSFNIFGISEFTARLPNAIIGLLSLQFIFWLGKKIQDANFGWWWALAYFGSILPHLYFKSGIIDPVFNLLMFAGIAFLFLGTHQQNKTSLGLLAGVCVGAAVLTKGPVAILLVGLCWLIAQFAVPKAHRSDWRTIAAAVAAGLATIGAWVALEIAAHGTWFIEEFLRYSIRLLSTEDAGHGGFPGYHVVILLLGCFPCSWLIFKAWKKQTQHFTAENNVFHNWMKILLIIIVVIFSIVQSKIVHYSSLAYFPISFFAAYAIIKLKDANSFPKYLKMAWLAQGVLMGIVCILAPILMANTTAWIDSIPDLMARTQLSAANSWPWYTFIPGLFLLFAIPFCLFKKDRSIQVRFTQLLLTTVVFLTIGLWCFIGRVEKMTQGALIEMCEEVADEGLILSHAGKSYAPFFYGKRLTGPPMRSGLVENLKATPGDVYVISRIHKYDGIKGKYDLELIREKNGYLLLRRKVR